MRHNRRITELSTIEFVGSLGQAFHLYGRELTKLAERWGIELEIAAADAEAAMSTMRGRWYMFGLDTRARSRRVAKRLKRARDLVAALADKGQTFPATYRRNFGGADEWKVSS
ncbi:unnamed protein product [[Actinomadura] parvosata subsp. kistnae]|uniref:Uncharacterized protein n=1 Tax=[Actinomadura] parvosata subsp. kistnae TaxID=1909395 RepID=A0A1V0ABR8_9ACTN|nr:hypothetical protein [Nonomuraea sp. ATCC 55076]AQZ67582.1 hypothetical protein BKM31_44465 [Nonomuraea sp. ATCC 55076]SPL94138.1 unnamed protein product [Actinomadura parvosata subsp. kistnae]